MSKIENVSAKSGRTTKKNLSWTDEETALLLQVIIDYKSSKAALGLDWETVKSKYDDICERLQSRYPKERDEIDPEEYPHYTDPSVITKEKIIPKIKLIKTQYRKAVDSGRRSGGSRVVQALYKECTEIWAGSPAVESLPNGIESNMPTASCASHSTLDEDSDFAIDLYPSSANRTEDLENQGNSTKEGAEVSGIDVASKPKSMKDKRRSLLEHLKRKKDEKLTKRLSVDAQLLDMAQQEIAIKRRAMEKMEEGEAKHEETMKMLTNNMTALTNVIANGFSMLQGLMYQPRFVIPPHVQGNNGMPSYGQHQPPPTNDNVSNETYTGESMLRRVFAEL